MSDLDSQAPDPLRTVRAVARAGWPLACLTAVVLGALGFAFRRTESRGDVPTWVLAVTTLLAFIAAAFAALVTYELLRLEGERDLKAARDRQLAAVDRDRSDRIIQGMDQVVIAGSHLAFKTIGFCWRGPQYHLWSGPDGEHVCPLLVDNPSMDRSIRQVGGDCYSTTAEDQERERD
jgi:hypothetical protein